MVVYDRIDMNKYRMNMLFLACDFVQKRTKHQARLRKLNVPFLEKQNDPLVIKSLHLCTAKKLNKT